MREKFKGVGAMLVDVNDDNLHETEMAKAIYKEINKNAKGANQKIGAKDIPMIVYSAFLYDKNSPIRKLPVDERKKTAVEYAQFDKKGDVDKAINLSDKRSLAIAHYYIRFQADEKWGLYVSISENFWRNTQKVLQGSDELKEQETINKLVTQNINYSETLDKLKDSIFGDNRELITDIVNFAPEDFVDELYKASGEMDDDDDSFVFEDD